MVNKVVAHFLDKTLVRGYTSDFKPDSAVFHLIAKEGGQEKSTPVKIASLKALFFVKELMGKDRSRPVVKRRFSDIKDRKLIGKKVQITFTDGEVLLGTTLGYSPKRHGFFFTPIDPESNNERIFAVTSSVKDITFIE